MRDLRSRGRADTSLRIDYLDRHVEVDGEEHGPMAAQLLSNVCGDDEARSGLRFSLGRDTSADDCRAAADILLKVFVSSRAT